MYATPDFTRGRIRDDRLPADPRRMFVLCWPARMSDILITPLHLMIERSLRERRRYTRNLI